MPSKDHELIRHCPSKLAAPLPANPRIGISVTAVPRVARISRQYDCHFTVRSRWACHVVDPPRGDPRPRKAGIHEHLDRVQRRRCERCPPVTAIFVSFVGAGSRVGEELEPQSSDNDSVGSIAEVAA